MAGHRPAMDRALQRLTPAGPALPTLARKKSPAGGAPPLPGPLLAATAALVSFGLAGLALIASGIAFVRGRHAASEAEAFPPVIEHPVPV